MPDAPDNKVVLPCGKEVPVIQMPSNLICTYQQMYDVCAEEVERTEPHLTIPKYNAFMYTLKKVRPDIKLRKFGKFTKCSTCAVIRELINLCSLRSKARQYWQDKMKEHLGGPSRTLSLSGIHVKHALDVIICWLLSPYFGCRCLQNVNNYTWDVFRHNGMA